MTTFWRVRHSDGKQLFWASDAGTETYQVYGDAPSSRYHPYERDRTLRRSIAALVEPSSRSKATGQRPRMVVTPFSPGEYHPRIWRGHYGPRADQYYEHEWSSATNAALSLFRGMEEVFRYVEPRKENMKTFGHEIRQFLVLACTEVEAQCKAVLRANSYAKTGNLNMQDYFKLTRAMRLNRWQVTLARYPHLGWFFPFKAWSTQHFASLPWYAAHNAAKHDRETAFAKATLKDLIDAMGAVFALVLAQFGQFGFQSLNHSDHTAFGYKWVEFGLDEHYLPPHVQPGAKWHPVPYRF